MPTIVRKDQDPRFEKLGMVTNTPKRSVISETFDLINAWESLSTRPDATLFGADNKTKPTDIEQGQIQDTFFVASAASMALDSDYLKSLFKLKNETDTSQLSFQMHAVGNTYEIKIDDTVPVY